jgi:hypothetical protein
VVLVILLAGGDDGDKTAATSPTTATETVTTDDTVTTPTDTGTPAENQAAQRDKRQVEQTVTTFVESAEQSDSARACAQVAGGAGKQIEDCAAAAGINLRQLPSSDELEVSSVKVSGDRATAKLSNGSSFSLGRSAGSWQITGFKPGPANGG